jgi:hypothetical protein
MNVEATNEITAAAVAMPAKKRAALAHVLLSSLPPPRRGQCDWDAVIAKRAKEVADGSAVTIPATDAMQLAKVRLSRS